MTTTYRRADAADVAAMAELAAASQADPATHIIYLGLDPDSIATDVRELDGWADTTVVAEHDGRLIGWLLAEVDADMGRLWWWGPYCSLASDDPEWADVTDRLHQDCRALVPDGIGEEEACPDARGTPIEAWCARHGLEADPASVLLRHDPPTGGHEQGEPDARVRPLAAGDHPVVMALHAEAFPGTHTTPEALVASDSPRLVIDVDGEVLGYVAHEMQSDGSGYIDYLAVATEARGGGYGGALVEAASAELFAEGASFVHLTVREDNPAARALYARVGFVEERIARPFRRGFRLP